MKRARFGGMLASIAALAAIGSVGGVSPAATSRTAEVSTQFGAAKGMTGTPAASVQNIVQQVAMRGGFNRYFTTQHPIWNGVTRRGNRRNRSRFNYNR